MDYIHVDGKSYPVIKTLDVLWWGWECDATAWMVLDGESIRVVATNHGQRVFAGKDFLEERISEYQRVLRETEEVLDMYNINHQDEQSITPASAAVGTLCAKPVKLAWGCEP